MKRNWLVIGNPENRRVEFFQAALANAQQPAATIIPYLNLLQHPDQTWAEIVELLQCDPMVRIESPGENDLVERLLIRRGLQDAMDEGCAFVEARQLEQTPYERGQILWPRQWFLGFRSLLLQLDELVNEHGGRFMNSPNDIVTMFDKVDCHQLLQRNQIPVARRLDQVSDFDDLMFKMDRIEMERCFIKLANGSSASGVVAIERAGERVRAITSTDMVKKQGEESKFYNSLKIRTYKTVEQVRELVNWICAHKAHAEEWIRKSTYDRKKFDVRFVTINGQSNHSVIRTSRHPMTNLHLGNERGEFHDDQRVQRLLTNMRSTCRRVSRLFPDSVYMGIDIASTYSNWWPFVIEVNAFGDLLPNVFHAKNGEDTYTSEVRALLELQSEKRFLAGLSTQVPLELFRARFQLPDHSLDTNLDSDELGLLGRIADSGEDATPHLVYADWLEERGFEVAAMAHRRLFAEGFRWSKITNKYTGLVHKGRSYGMFLGTGPKIRCWHDTNGEHQKHFGLLEFQMGIRAIVKGVIELRALTNQIK